MRTKLYYSIPNVQSFLAQILEVRSDEIGMIQMVT